MNGRTPAFLKGEVVDSLTAFEAGGEFFRLTKQHLLFPRPASVPVPAACLLQQLTVTLTQPLDDYILPPF
jgi:hypothetical protein